MFSVTELNKKVNRNKKLLLIENSNESCNLSITYVEFESVTFDQIFMFVELKCQCNKKFYSFWDIKDFVRVFKDNKTALQSSTVSFFFLNNTFHI